MELAREFFGSNFPIIGKERLDNIISGLKNLPDTLTQGTGIRSNTTVFAIKYENGVVVAGDRRMADGWYGIMSDSVVKVHQISNFSAIACAGYCNVISFLEENMTSICMAFQERYGRELSIDGQANYLKSLLEGWWFTFLAYRYWDIGVPVLAAFDQIPDRPRIFSFDADGFYFESEFTAGTGCGWNSVKNVIADRRCEVKTNDDAIELAVRAMIHSGISSHGVSDVRTVLPKVATIDVEGFKWISEEIIAGKRDKLFSENGGLSWLK